jgi:hypothetical protein
MKAITLTQPWATLVAIGAKRIETRSWGTKYRGPLAIHAAKGWTKEAVRLVLHEPFRSVLNKAGYQIYSNLPRGCIVATCELVSVREINRYRMGIGWGWTGPDGTKYEFDQQERCFGDYADGRRAWLLDNVQRLAEPIPARGALSLWEWHNSFLIN